MGEQLRGPNDRGTRFPRVAPALSTAAAALVRDAIALYPSDTREYYLRDADRIAHDLSWVLVPGGRLVDVGGGLSPLALAATLGGMQVEVLDTFDYPVESQQLGPAAAAIVEQLKSAGVRVTSCDVARTPLPVPSGWADCATCLAVIEHLHSSPRPLFHDLRRVLRPGGRLVVSAPNAVNLRKRFDVLRGRSNLPSVQAFWSCTAERWPGHVREPTLRELSWIVGAAGFKVIRLFGRNFIARQNYGRLAAILDAGLRLLPGLCSDLYAIGAAPHPDQSEPMS